MPGTIVGNLRLTKVVDGDTIKVLLDDTEESLRLTCLDTEESWSGGKKPVTAAGKRAAAWAKEFFGADGDGIPRGEVTVDIEFDTADPVPTCLKIHRGNYGRLICYAHLGAANYNLAAVSAGHSPYFVKYGYSRLHHRAFTEAEADAQARGLGIWNPETNAGGPSRDYRALMPWWHVRGAAVDEYRHAGRPAGVQSVRLNYDGIVEAARMRSPVTVLCDLQGGVNRWVGGGALIYAGSIHHKFDLWIPDRDSQSSQELLSLIETRYGGTGRSYVYVSGTAEMYPDENGKPQIVVSDRTQLSDIAPGTS